MSTIRRAQPILAVVLWAAALAAAFAGIASGRVLMGPVIAVPGYGTVGMILATRRVGTRIAWLLLGMAAVCVLALVAIPPEMQNGLIVAGLAIVLVIFPTGRPPGRTWAVPMTAVLLSWASIWWLGIIDIGGFSLPIGVVVAAGSLAWCAAAPIYRFRRAGGIERAQLRWLGAAASLGIIGIVVAGISVLTKAALLMNLAGLLVVAVFALGIPAAILVAVVRYRLFAIERIVSRTVTYAVVATLAGAAYAVPVIGASQILHTSGDLVTAGATLFAAALVSPIRRRVRLATDRRFNRSSLDRSREAEELGAWLRTATDVPAIMGRLADVAARIYEPASLHVWVRASPAP